jgi:glyoxylase-like metal-dependent hydrolase (beta-lactamase superfamily II)
MSMIASLLLAAQAALAPDSPRAVSAPSEPTVLSADLQVRQLKPGLWLHTSWSVLADGTRFPSNGLLLDEGTQLLLIDTAWGEAPTEQLLKWVESELRKPVRAAVVTHFHDDRLGGGPALQRRGIPFYGHPLTRELAGKKGVLAPRALDGLGAIGTATRQGGVEVFYPGPAHTRDNVVVWLPKERVLAGGCPVRAAGATSLGNVADADVAQYAASMRRVAERYPEAELVVPGHGAPGGAELVRNTIDVAARAAAQ